VVDLQKNTSQIWIFQLTFAHAVRATTLSGFKGDPFPGSGLLVHGGSMAVSPDAPSWLHQCHATAGTARAGRTRSPSSTCAPARAALAGRPVPAGQTFTIRASPDPDGRSLVFRAVWCRPIPNSDVCRTTRPAGYRGPRSGPSTSKQGRNARSRQHPAAQPVGPLPRHPDAARPGGGTSSWPCWSGPPDAATLTVERVDAAGKRLVAVGS